MHPKPNQTTYKEFHLGNFLIDLFHELNDEIDQLVLQHGLRVEVGNQERDIIALFKLVSIT